MRGLLQKIAEALGRSLAGKSKQNPVRPASRL